MSTAFVVQRYGAEVAGGAEALCRATARALVARGEAVEVYTTTARDYLAWEGHFPAGRTVEDGVVVHRFAADPADPALSGRLVRRLALGGGDAAAERVWARAQGPVAPGLVAALADALPRRHEVLALWTYLYATTQLAMPLAPERTILVPLAHDEPMFRFGLTRGLMRMAAGLALMTPEEARLVDDVHGIGDRPAEVVGAGIDPPPATAPAEVEAHRRDLGLPSRFALYVGRVDPAKGVAALVDAHAAYRSAGGALGLVLAGRPAGAMALPDWVVTTGFVDGATHAALLAAAEVVVLPSPHESLSLVALEAWSAGRPTLATARSEVLAGQTSRSGGGLLYLDAPTYGRQLGRLAGDAGLRDRLAGSGRAWVAATATWDVCADRWRDLLARVRRPLSPAQEPVSK